MITPAEILTAVQALAEARRLTRSASDAFGDAETKLKLSELMNRIADAEGALRDASDAIREKDERISELEQLLQLSGQMRFEDNVYWRRYDNGVIDGPYCPRCWDAEKKQIRLFIRDNGYRECKTCNSRLDFPKGREPRDQEDEYDSFGGGRNPTTGY